MKKPLGIANAAAAALAALFIPFGSHAAARARNAAETVLRNASVRLAAGTTHTCQANHDGTVRCWGINDHGQLGDGTRTNRQTPVAVSGLLNAVAIAAGIQHTCALLANGGVRCWGDNFEGQLGDGTGIDRLGPVPVTGITNAVAIAAGDRHTCALLANGSARCWGENTHGKLGDDTTIRRLAPVAVSGLLNAVAIAAGGGHTCALLANGSVRCWGQNAVGQLGDGSFLINQRTPVPVSGLANAVAIAAGSGHTCALLANGSARCWGLNNSGQLGDNSTTNRFTPALPVSGLANAVAIAAGVSHTCALLADGRARCWGFNGSGQLGDGFTTNQPTPVTVSGLANAVAIDSGGGHTCALLADGVASCWGSNTFGELGNGTVSPSFTPTTVAGGGSSVTARDIAAGSSHACAVRANSTVACWGDNGSGQLGDGSTTGRLTPVAVSGIANAVAIAAGDEHTCALLANGSVRCWGRGGEGQLGDGSTTSRLTPVAVSGIASAVAIAAGDFHTCALLADGGTRCWGLNTSGQLGDGSTTNRLAQVPVLADAVAIAAGGQHTCALVAGGSVLCWGLNTSGQVGDSTTTNRLTPAGTVGITQAVAIAAGSFHSCALLADGATRCWGSNLNGELGDTTTTQRHTPVAVISLLDAVASAAGGFHTCGLLAFGTFGTARCWGANSSGQIGDGTTAQQLMPATPAVAFLRRTPGGFVPTVAPLLNIVQIATGRSHTCAIIANGAVRCWGENGLGQLGIDSTTDQSRPVLLPSFTLNIDPLVTLNRNTRVATVQIIATCDAGQQLHVNVTLTQGSVSARGIGFGECTGGVERYPVTVPAHGRYPFVEGPAVVEAGAVIRERGLIVDTQEWTRAVQLVARPRGGLR